MKKVYFLKIGLLLTSIILLILLWLSPCEGRLNRCFWGNDIFTKATFHFVLSIFIISIPALFISDKTFFKWLRLASVWLIITIISITLAPTYSGGYFNYGITKELISIWLGALFVISSLSLFVWMMYKCKK